MNVKLSDNALKVLQRRYLKKDEAESIHLTHYPEPNEKLIISSLEDAVDRMQQIILLGRQKRNQVQIKVKTPLKKITIIHKDQELLNEIKKLENYIVTELNVKSIEYSTDEDRYINLYAKPNLPVLGKRLGKDMGRYMKAIKDMTAQMLKELEKKGSISLLDQTFSVDDFLIFREAKSGTEALSNRLISIDIDCKLDQNLIDEGLAREVVNRIQRTRKEIKLNVEDRVSIKFFATDNLKRAILNHKPYICLETLAVDLIDSKSPFDHQYDIDEEKLELTISKV